MVVKTCATLTANILGKTLPSLVALINPIPANQLQRTPSRAASINGLLYSICFSSSSRSNKAQSSEVLSMLMTGKSKG
ncbi:hypothetical protein PtB15_14B48 [Puccinia triticina]|nr:hypothetical protein PtB15_14B48 [Puccinia triticina]